MLRAVILAAALAASAHALRLTRGAVFKGGIGAVGASLAVPSAGAVPPEQTTKSGLRYVVDRAGSGPKPARGQMATLDYVLRAAVDGKPPVYVDGTKQSVPPKPQTFTLGVEGQIPGFDEAVLDMQVGEKRIVIVPPELAYGKQGTEAVGGVIPPDATLIYSIELRGLAPLAVSAEQQKWISANPLPWEK